MLTLIGAVLPRGGAGESAELLAVVLVSPLLLFSVLDDDRLELSSEDSDDDEDEDDEDDDDFVGRVGFELFGLSNFPEDDPDDEDCLFVLLLLLLLIGLDLGAFKLPLRRSLFPLRRIDVSE